jgi:phosphopentomutase
MARTADVWRSMVDGFLLVNLVDFDTVYGHRRDPEGYARALVEFDSWLAGFLRECRAEDLVIITADHGNDPTFRGTDHTRETVPLLVAHGETGVALGLRETFADVGASVAEFFGVRWPVGASFMRELRRGAGQASLAPQAARA